MMQAEIEHVPAGNDLRRQPPQKKNYLNIVLLTGVALVVGGVVSFIVSDGSKMSNVDVDTLILDGADPVTVAAEGADGLDALAPEALLTDPELAPVERPVELDGSDKQVVEAVRDMSPGLLAWLTPDEQIRKWVLMTANLADGDLISKHRPLVYPMRPFKTERKNGITTMSSANYARTDKLVAAITAIPPEKMAAYYRQWSPVLERSFGELGLEGSFHGHVQQLIYRALAVEALPVSPALSRPHVLYTYTDARLEAAGDLEKLLWRIGPENMARLQEYLVLLNGAL